MRPLVARPDGELEVLGGFRPAARSGGRMVKLELTNTIPLPEGTTLMHLPGRRALALDAKDRPVDVEADLLPVSFPSGTCARWCRHHDRCREAAAFLCMDTRPWWNITTSSGSPR
jgi:hypothetical protein